MRRRIHQTSVAGYNVPPELVDESAEVWLDRAAHLAYMAERAWPLDVRDRMGPGAPPKARRQVAVETWAVAAGIVSGPWSADLHRLKAMRLYP